MRLREKPVDYQMLLESYFANCYRLPRELKADDVVIDLGAHIGAFSLLAIHAGCRNLIAVEPHDGNYEVLYDNLAEAHKEFPGEYETFLAAAWTDSGRCGFKPSMESTMHRAVPLGETVGDVRAVTLDYLIGKKREIAFLKVDIEGVELPVLGASKLLDRVRCASVEVHEMKDAKEVSGVLYNAGLVVQDAEIATGNRVMVFARRK